VRVGRPHKYGAKRTTVDGIAFASKREAERYQELLLLQRAKQISELELQPPFDLFVANVWGPEPTGLLVKVGRYVADFAYRRNGERVFEDVKGVRTETYRLKKKMVEATYGIRIIEV